MLGRRRRPNPLLATLATLVAGALLLAGCAGDDQAVDPIALDGAERPGQPDGTADDPDDDEAALDGSDDQAQRDPADGDAADADEGDDDAHAADDAARADEAASDPNGSGLAGLAAAGVVDLTVAEPGIWPVGNAGTVAFDLDDRDLALRGIEAAPGWNVEVEEEKRDEIEVTFRRDRERWRFLVERSGSRLEVRIDQRIDGADPGGYDLGDAGTFAFAVRDGRFALTSLEVADGWSLRDRDVDDDEIELELRADDRGHDRRDERRVDVEVELDDGAIELEIDYRVRSRLP
jgi:hypothetical protein